LDRTATGLEFQTTHARDGSLGLSTLSDQIGALKPRLGLPLVAVNGDFYVFEGKPYAGDPRGLQVLDGNLISAPNGGPVFWIDAQGQPQGTNVVSRFRVTWPNGTSTPFGLNEERLTNTTVLYTAAVGKTNLTTNGCELVLEREGNSPWLPLRLGDTLTARVREVRQGGKTPLSSETMVLSIHPMQTNRPPTVETGAVLRLALHSSPDLAGVKTALGGGPMLVCGSKRQKLKQPKFNGPLPYEFRSMMERHPRTALGWNDRHFYLVVVDGRQLQLSKGMTLTELTSYMLDLGCTEVVNLDGGGSATLWCNGFVLNRPCDGWERVIANALVVLRTAQAPDAGDVTSASAHGAESGPSAQ
jgi:hypothetical protein